MFRKTSAATNDYDALDTMYVIDLTHYLSAKGTIELARHVLGLEPRHAVQLKRKAHPRP